ncbi:MAG: hypothetical protein OXF27_00430 [Acidobacteria bacterium]|nr:hypothetical protein [Acidobacteriota bacterium]
MEMDIRGLDRAPGVVTAREFLEPAARAAKFGRLPAFAAGAGQVTHRANNQKIKENIHVNRTDGTRK